ncbi:ATP-binding protein [Nitrospirillum amazonense]|uniref:histidine kinase n=1 Tax=Nitrospirillum amazonense TaxID=28077 RepID=A0A560KNT0_9PROT|nr:ATP-binding protein [Nitrospirillum amazonense]MDG3443520.1 ATP-binding protein [Nitrospirillum amazonense]TWB82340.1 two-component system sensor histidine kinase AdeS [Nitrospirillum amazonense]
MWHFRRITGLNRQLVLSMAAVTGLALVLMTVGLTIFFTLMFRLWPDLFHHPPGIWQHVMDWSVTALLGMVGVAMAARAAVRFARRLIAPLDAVAGAAKRIAGGDLTARAPVDESGFRETKQLVQDFNAMAAQLERAAIEMRTWNVAIAHELRTPLTILRGRLQGYADGVFTPDMEAFRGLVGQVDLLTRIVDDLKLLTLAQSGRLELRRDQVDVAAEAAAVVALVGPTCAAAGLAIETDLAPLEVSADGARVRQALLALLENARRYAAPGRVRVETKAEAGSVVLRVADEGPGLPPGMEAHAFDPFWRADDSRARISGGTGLGLAVVQAIARAHGGDVRAEPVTPQGVAFEIRLPLRP